MDWNWNLFPKGLGLGKFLDDRYTEDFKGEREVPITEPNLTP